MWSPVGWLLERFERASPLRLTRALASLSTLSQLEIPLESRESFSTSFISGSISFFKYMCVRGWGGGGDVHPCMHTYNNYAENDVYLLNLNIAWKVHGLHLLAS